MQVATPQILADLMNNLHRFFKIGIYYPSGHAVADQAAESFLHSLNIIAGKDDTYVRFVASETTLSVQGLELDNSLLSVEHFHDLLHSLSISTIDLHRDITNDELRIFLSKLLFLRTQVQSSNEFHEIDISGLPSTVKVHQLKFLASQSATDSKGSGDPTQPTIDFLLSSLVQHGLKGEQVSMCRDMLESIPDALSNRQIAESDLPSVTWDDVERLLRSVAETFHSSDQNSQTNLPEQHQNIDALVAILKSLGGTTGEGKSRDAINLLVKMSKGSAPQSQDKEKKKLEPRKQNDQPTLTMDELRRLLPPFKRETLPADLGENNRSEELSIFMQMLGQEHGLHSAMKVQEALRDCLRAPLKKREWQVVIQGTQHLLKILDQAALKEAVLLILDILRRSEYTTPLVYLRDVCQGLSKDEFVACWPFLINELFLAGPRDNHESFNKICSLAAVLPLQDMHSNLARVERLNALSEKRVAPAIFSPPPTCLHSLFVLLLNSSHATYIYEQLVTGLKRHPVGWLDKGVAPLLDSTLASHQQFIIDLLRQEDPKKPERSLKKIGAGIIVEKLPEIPEERRTDEWVPNAIGVLAKTQVPGGRELLDTIFTSKHYLIFADWPRDARRAAGKALSTMY